MQGGPIINKEIKEITSNHVELVPVSYIKTLIKRDLYFPSSNICSMMSSSTLDQNYKIPLS